MKTIEQRSTSNNGEVPMDRIQNLTTFPSLLGKMMKKRRISKSWRFYILIVLMMTPIVLVYFTTSTGTSAITRESHRNSLDITRVTDSAIVSLRDRETRIKADFIESKPSENVFQATNKENNTIHVPSADSFIKTTKSANSTANKTVITKEKFSHVISKSKSNITDTRLSKQQGTFNRLVDKAQKLRQQELPPGPVLNRPDHEWVVSLHEAGGKKSKRDKLCPLWPPELIGPLKVSSNTNVSQVKLTDTQRRLVTPGGRFAPQDCLPREKTAVIIPFRDREEHLEILVNHLHTILQRQSIQYGIFVIELAYPTQFNRGLLANIGFLSASSVDQYTCYIFHDVDMLAADDRNMYRCGRYPRHLVGSSSKFQNSLPYMGYFGAVEAFTADQYWSLNGFSNLYFGWGGEDDDIVHRMIDKEIHFSRPSEDIGSFVALDHKSDAANPVNPNRLKLVRTAAARSKSDGVRNVQYTRIALEFRPLYTWVLASANEARYLQKFHQFL